MFGIHILTHKTAYIFTFLNISFNQLLKENWHKLAKNYNSFAQHKCYLWDIYLCISMLHKVSAENAIKWI